MALDIKAAKNALAATGTMDGLRLEGNNHKITLLLSLHKHLTDALEQIEELEMGIRVNTRGWGGMNNPEQEALQQQVADAMAERYPSIGFAVSHPHPDRIRIRVIDAGALLSPIWGLLRARLPAKIVVEVIRG